jgi:hypothetical protein
MADGRFPTASTEPFDSLGEMQAVLLEWDQQDAYIEPWPL